MSFDASANTTDLLTEGSPPLYAKGEGVEMKREHEGPVEVLLSPVLTFSVVLAVVAYVGTHQVFLTFMGILLSLTRAKIQST